MFISTPSLRVSFLFLLGVAGGAAQTPADVSSRRPVTQVSGQIQTEQGTPVEGAVVTARMLSSIHEHLMSSLAVSNPEGGFRFDNLPAGKYRLCVRATDQALLDPCRWDQAASRFSVQNETSLSLLPVQLERGKLIRVRIVDHRPMVSGSKAPPPIAGLWNDQGLFTTLPGKNAGSAQRVHEVYIPAEKSQQLTVSAPKGRVVSSSELHDETGNTARFQVRMEKTEKRPREIVLEVHPN